MALCTKVSSATNTDLGPLQMVVLLPLPRAARCLSLRGLLSPPPSQPAGTEPPSNFRSGSFLRDSYTVLCSCLWRNFGPPGLSCLLDAGSPMSAPGPSQSCPCWNDWLSCPLRQRLLLLPSPRESGWLAKGVSHLWRRQRALTSCRQQAGSAAHWAAGDCVQAAGLFSVS